MAAEEDKIQELKRNLKFFDEKIKSLDKEITKFKKERIKLRKQETEAKRILTILIGNKKRN